MIHGLKSEGVTVLLSSHLLDQVQKICDRVALFSAGRIALMGSVAELSAQVLGGGFQAIVEAGDGAAAVLKNLDGVGRIVADGGGLHLYAERDLRADIARALVAANIPLLRLSRVEPSLDEIYRRYFEGVRHAA
ncbi:MAG: hypothetical protein FJX52_15400 [Alphaproteobacteria bacterium]|nr:hypothetical protein [Alphaproteobacteria bacterium]